MAYLSSGKNKIMGSSVSTDANVVTVIDENSTDEQIPSAKAVYDKLSDLPTDSGSKCYTSLDELGLTADASIDDVISALKDGESFIGTTSLFTNYLTMFPNEEANYQYAVVRIERSTASRTIIEWYTKYGTAYAIGGMGDDNKFNGWKNIITENKLNNELDTKITVKLTSMVGMGFTLNNNYTTEEFVKGMSGYLGTKKAMIIKLRWADDSKAYVNNIEINGGTLYCTQENDINTNTWVTLNILYIPRQSNKMYNFWATKDSANISCNVHTFSSGTVDLTEVNTRLAQLENKQINKLNVVDMEDSEQCYKITLTNNNTFSKILITDLYGGCILITGSLVSEYKTFKVVRLSNGSWESYNSSTTGANKILNVYYDNSFIYIKCGNYFKGYFEGGFVNVEKISPLPTDLIELPIVDLTQGSTVDLTEVNTKIAQLENKTSTIPVIADNPSDKDFNNYKTNGYYSIGINDYANKPDNTSGTLLVFSAKSYKAQLYITNNGNMYFRNFGSSWSEWVNVNSGTGGGTGGVGDVVIDNASISMGRKSGTTIGNYSTASGYDVEASGNYSHAEGYTTTASGTYSHAEGYGSDAIKQYCHAEGCSTTASGTASHAEGYTTTASGNYSHAEGEDTIASGDNSHAEGCSTTASGKYSHAEGYFAEASGKGSHAEGYHTTASGTYSHAGGYHTIANDYQYTIGHCNADTTGGATNTTSGSAFIIGNGTNSNSYRKNAFRVDYNGTTYGAGAYNTSGADYAEYFEWIDGNVDNEDRRGLFVTLDGDKIKLANDGDYILGVVSSNPVVLGNSDMEWQGRFLKDKFGSLRIEKQMIKDVDEQGNEIEKEVEWYITNPEYDPNLEYVERKDRQEWTPVGFMGQLVVIDDGTCVVNGYCKCGVNGVATKADNGYRVMKRIDENTILVLIK